MSMNSSTPFFFRIFIHTIDAIRRATVVLLLFKYEMEEFYRYFRWNKTRIDKILRPIVRLIVEKLCTKLLICWFISGKLEWNAQTTTTV